MLNKEKKESILYEGHRMFHEYWYSLYMYDRTIPGTYNLSEEGRDGRSSPICTRNYQVLRRGAARPPTT